MPFGLEVSSTMGGPGSSAPPDYCCQPDRAEAYGRGFGHFVEIESVGVQLDHQIVLTIVLAGPIYRQDGNLLQVVVIDNVRRQVERLLSRECDGRRGGNVHGGIRNRRQRTEEGHT